MTVSTLRRTIERQTDRVVTLGEVLDMLRRELPDDHEAHGSVAREHERAVAQLRHIVETAAITWAQEAAAQ